MASKKEQVIEEVEGVDELDKAEVKLIADFSNILGKDATRAQVDDILDSVFSIRDLVVEYTSSNANPNQEIIDYINAGPASAKDKARMIKPYLKDVAPEIDVLSFNHAISEYGLKLETNRTSGDGKYKLGDRFFPTAEYKVQRGRGGVTRVLGNLDSDMLLDAKAESGKFLMFHNDKDCWVLARKPFGRGYSHLYQWDGSTWLIKTRADFDSWQEQAKSVRRANLSDDVKGLVEA